MRQIAIGPAFVSSTQLLLRWVHVLLLLYTHLLAGEGDVVVVYGEAGGDIEDAEVLLGHATECGLASAQPLKHVAHLPSPEV